MSRSIATKRLGYEARRRLDNLRYGARRNFVISRHRRSELNDSSETAAESNPRIKALPASAFPLGYAA